jgi:hypothetical protein
LDKEDDQHHKDHQSNCHRHPQGSRTRRTAPP